MTEKIQMTEEQAREFCDDIGFSDKETVIYLMKKRGYIRKSELQQKVEEAEEAWEHYRINCLSPDFESDDRDEVIMELHQAFIALKQSHPEFKGE